MMIAVWILGFLILAATGAVLTALVVVARSIESQFFNNSGSTLRDAIDRLEHSTDRLEIGFGRLEALGQRIEDGAIEDRILQVGVAQDLSAQHDRADAVPDGLPGEASDAASRSAVEGKV